MTNLVSSSHNRKSLWYYLKTREQGNDGIGTLIHPENGNALTDPIEKATVLNDHFKSVVTTDDNMQ